LAALPFAVVHTIATARALQQRVSKAFTPQHARLPEICDCHADAWIPGRSRKWRLTVLKRYGVGGPCCMQVRHTAWLVAEGMACLVRDILRNTTSESMQQLPAAMPTARQGEIVAAYAQLRIDLLETLTEKLMHFQHAPYAATGALYYEYGGPLTRAHQFLKLCSGDWDAAVARRFGVVGACQQGIDRFLLDRHMPLSACPHIWRTLHEHALMPGAERRTEETHARIHRVDLTMLA